MSSTEGKKRVLHLDDSLASQQVILRHQIGEEIRTSSVQEILELLKEGAVLEAVVYAILKRAQTDRSQLLRPFVSRRCLKREKSI